MIDGHKRIAALQQLRYRLPMEDHALKLLGEDSELVRIVPNPDPFQNVEHVFAGHANYLLERGRGSLFPSLS